MQTTKKTIRTGDGFATMMKEAVTASKEWTVAMREASIDPMLKMLSWNQPALAIMEPWVHMTRQAHDGWLQCWESQSHDMIEKTSQAIETGTRYLGKDTLP